MMELIYICDENISIIGNKKFGYFLKYRYKYLKISQRKKKIFGLNLSLIYRCTMHSFKR